MTLAWKLVACGWRRLGDVGKLKTIWWLLPPAAAAGLTGLWANSATSPLLLWLFSVIVFAIVFIALLTAVGYCELEKIKAVPPNFKCDFHTLQKICLLLAEVKEDCLNYNPYGDLMAARQIQLEEHQAIFLESGLKQEFILFAHAVKCLVGNKCLQFHGKERIVEVITISSERIAENYPKLKAALDDDYEKARP